VFLPPEDRLGVKTVRHAKVALAEQGCKLAIMLHPANPTPHALNEVHEGPIRFQLFSFNQLEFYLPENEFVSDAVRLSPEDAKKIIATYGEKSLPILPASDPLVELRGWQLGDVIRVEKAYKGLEKCRSYCIVVQSA